ncbi:M23 family metallopeptidase [Gaetbulibacter aestuarii]|uniref:M23 family metallopeptidase n=1 Tax=Gaetbulibacter aestuarii TaxID=1502358 RepID=A0ABW7MZA8_9FLAO
MRFIPILLFFSVFVAKAQSFYPQDYFKSPLDIPLILAGTFAELRSNHFHSGMDIKTQQREGLKVKAAADGYVSRIKISHYGYGKALYVTHPNGYTTVYGHLQQFNDTIENYIKKKQYSQESYEIEAFPSAGELPVKQGEFIAYSGNTGGSGGPHLHFEIRDKNQYPMNPMLFGIDIKDTTHPYVSSVFAYPMDENSGVNNENSRVKLRLIPLQNGDYITENVDAVGKIGFGIETNDRQDQASNSNGVYNIATFLNGQQNFDMDFRKFSFAESKHINQLIDYGYYETHDERIQKLFRINNPLSIIKDAVNDGFVTIKDSTNAVYKIRVADFKNNETWVTININGTKKALGEPAPVEKTPYYIHHDQKVNLSKDGIDVTFNADTFYEDFYIDFDVKNDTLTLHKDVVPAKKYFKISFDVSQYKPEDINHLYIARLVGYNGFPAYSATKRIGNTLTTEANTLGTYTIAMDTIAPTITPRNFFDGQWMSNFRFLKLKIEDEASGISAYRATVNGKWILMEYDYKTNTLTHDFNDNMIQDVKNNLKVVVVDNAGNSTTFKAVFYRK